MRFGINTFLFASPFTNKSTKLFPQFKKWGFDTVEIPVEDPSHIDPAFVKRELDRHGLVCGAFSDLRADESLHLIYDYEPRPLRRRFEKTFSQQFVWAQRRLARLRLRFDRLCLLRMVDPFVAQNATRTEWKPIQGDLQPQLPLRFAPHRRKASAR